MSFANALKSAQAKNTLNTPKDVDAPIAKQWRAEPKESQKPANGSLTEKWLGIPKHIDDSPHWPNIEVNLSRKRIELYFDNKPNQRVLDLLKVNRFCWDRIIKCWHNFDTPAVRSFLEDNFCADFDAHRYKHFLESELPPESPNDGQGEAISAPDATEPSLDTSSPLAVYRRQVDELLAHLQIAPADLILVAIDSLHKSTFSRDA